MSEIVSNPYISGPVARVFIKTALPIIALTSLNGLLTVVDAMFLGVFVGPEAITAVTLVFPISMLLIALSSMVSTGMASIMGRLIGAGEMKAARRIFAGAHGLSLLLCAIVIVLFIATGRPLIEMAAGGFAPLAEMSYAFLGISVIGAPLLFLLSVQSDALRQEGRIGFMALAGALVTLGNLALNYALIVWFDLGVAGSALGTVAAQGIAVLAIIAYRRTGRAPLTLSGRDFANWRAGWGEMLALGAPRSLTFIGISLSAAATMVSLSLTGGAHFEASVAAYGIITRIVSLAFFPLLGMSLAVQAMVGNNAGAGLWARSNETLKLSLLLSLGYSLLVEVVFVGFRHQIAGLFTSEAAVIAEIDRIIPLFLAFYFTVGPMMMISSYFQSLGDVKRSAILALSRTYLFALPLIFVLPTFMGENGVWLAAPVADLMLVLVTATMLHGLTTERRWGLFRTA